MTTPWRHGVSPIVRTFVFVDPQDERRTLVD